ncbi:hypothetical protein V6N12_049334 [Hibiscus sabdariffa]|uniref:Uncharacterized protein n=1 Tax=Hibiscus sabdariffa TaxID=183260 RepID=A0ABR2CBF0_9ROSI
MVATEIKHEYHGHNLRLTFSGDIEDDSQCDGSEKQEEGVSKSYAYAPILVQDKQKPYASLHQLPIEHGSTGFVLVDEIMAVTVVVVEVVEDGLGQAYSITGHHLLCLVVAAAAVSIP